jgi:hypothetical protein
VTGVQTCALPIFVAYRDYESKTIALLKEPDVWAAVEALAKALCKKGKVMADEVEEILSGAGFKLFCTPDLRRQFRDQRP